MTHDELLAKINAWEYSDYKSMGTISEWPYKIIRAVVELHKPFNVGTTKIQCRECMEWDMTPGENMKMADYPCPTIQAIEKELI